MSDSKALALAAAHQAQLAAAALLQFAIEGPHYRRPPFGDDVEVIETLADALKMALEVEDAELTAAGGMGHPDDAEQRNQLLGAVSRFLEGWAA